MIPNIQNKTGMILALSIVVVSAIVFYLGFPEAALVAPIAAKCGLGVDNLVKHARPTPASLEQSGGRALLCTLLVLSSSFLAWCAFGPVGALLIAENTLAVIYVLKATMEGRD